MDPHERSIESLIEEAHSLMIRGRHDDACWMLDKVLRRDPTNRTALEMQERIRRITGVGALHTMPLPPEGSSIGQDAYASLIAYQAGLNESARLGVNWNPFPTPASAMWQRARIPLIVLMVLYIPLAVHAIYVDITASIQADSLAMDEFSQSSGCGGNGAVNPVYPPCSSLPAVIASKGSETRPSEAYGTYTTYNLTVHRQDGVTETYGGVGDYLWGQVHVGETVSVTMWRGRSMKMVAPEGQANSANLDPQTNANFSRVTTWGVCLFVDMLALQCFFPRRRRGFGLYPGGYGW